LKTEQDSLFIKNKEKFHS